MRTEPTPARIRDFRQVIKYVQLTSTDGVVAVILSELVTAYATLFSAALQTEQTFMLQDTFPIGVTATLTFYAIYEYDDTNMVVATLSRTEAWSLVALLGACFSIISNTFQGDGEPLIAALAFSGLAFASTYALTRWLGPKLISIGLKGRDMSKTNGQVM